MTRTIRYTFIAVASTVAILIATPSDAQCYFDISAYADSSLDGYDGNGNGMLSFWGGAIDNSSCQGAEHSYAASLGVRRISTGEIIAAIVEFFGSIFVAPDEYQIEFSVGVWCSYFQNWVGGATAYTQRAVPQQCAVPVNFRQVGPGVDAGNGRLDFHYEWESSSGRLSDLGACDVGELVEYSSDDIPFPPPFPAANPPNPTIIDVPGSDGAFDDRHSTPGAFRPPFFENTITANQVYRYSCPCQNAGNPVTMMGWHPIVRNVQLDGVALWRFTITKTGSSATIFPL